MPIVINSKSCSNAGWWAKHVRNTKANERVEIMGFYDLSAETIEEAFSEMRAMAAGSKAKNFFSAYNINPRGDEQLTEAQWEEAHALRRKNHGLDHLPYFRVAHFKRDKEGNLRRHEHGFALRVDPETGKAISDSLTAPINEQTSRTLETRFDLARGKSVLTAKREQSRTRRAPKRETFRDNAHGIDTEQVSRDAKAARSRSDNGRSFRVALETSGEYALARGDRRDFVIIDRASNDHSLGRRLGMKAAALRAFMADLDPATLPSVTEAKAQQRARHGEPEIHRQRAAAKAQEREEHEGAADGPRQDDTRTGEPQRAAEGQSKPIKTADKIREAAAGESFARGLADAGLKLAFVTREEAAAISAEISARFPARRSNTNNRDAPDPWMKASGGVAGLTAEHRESAERSFQHWAEEKPELARRYGFASYVDYVQERWAEQEHDEEQEPTNRRFRFPEGVAVVDAWGSVYAINARTAGEHLETVKAQLERLDTGAMASVAQAREEFYSEWRSTAFQFAVAREQQRFAEWQALREPTATERKILDAAKQAGDDRQQFTAELDKEGLGVARVTPADVAALDKLRQAEAMSFAADPTYQPKFFPQVEAGELVAVDRHGGINRLNPQHMIAAGLEAPTSSTVPPSEQPSSSLPSVEIVRTAFAKVEQERVDFQQTMIDAQLLRQDEQTSARVTDFEFRQEEAAGQAFDRDLNRAADSAEQGVDSVFDGAEKFATGIFEGLVKPLESIIDRLGESLFPTAPPTREEAKGMRRSAEERRQENAELAAYVDRARQHDDVLRQMAKDDAERLRQRRERGDMDEVDRGRERDM